jgi:hypothetical protein
MRYHLGRVVIVIAAIGSAAVVGPDVVAGLRAQTTSPDSLAWAYGVPNTPPAAGAQRGGAPRQPDASPKHIPDSLQTFTIPQLRDFFNVADWFPNEHPPMP